MAALLRFFVSFFEMGCCAIRSESGKRRMSLAYSRDSRKVSFKLTPFFFGNLVFRVSFLWPDYSALELIDIIFTTLTMSLGNDSRLSCRRKEKNWGRSFYVLQRAEY
jgi:hypothetical protein